MKVKEFIAKQNLRFKRGDNWIAMLRSIVLFALLGKQYGMPDSWIPVIAVIYLSGGWLIGWIDERFGLWKYENDRAMQITPFMVEIKEGLRK